MRRAFSFFFSSTLLAAALLALAPASPADAQEEEARLLFERGNGHLAAGMRARGARRTRELSEALDAYLGVLRLGARTRNVVFNLALTLQELGREAEAFNYYSQYLHEFELSAEDRTAGQERVDAIRPRVAVASITSTPAGAEVRVGRRDLPVRGTTPLELALPAGQHTLIFSLDGFEDTTAEVTVAVGRSSVVAAELVGRPVAVQFIAPGGGRLLLDGVEVQAGRSIAVRPGAHLVRLELPNAPPVERHFEVQPGGEPMNLTLAPGGPAGTSRVVLEANAETEVYLDGMPVGRGAHVEFPALPGDHTVRVEAPGRTTASQSVTLAPDQTVALTATLGERASTGGLYAGRGITGVIAALGLIGASVTTGLAFDLRDQWDALLARQRDNGGDAMELTRIADELEAAALAADILWGITAAVGTAAIVLLIVDPGSDGASTIEVAA
ncbi:MAG: PEGA domain-containing protein, partial [Sandaracinaceae bacterium]